MKKLSFILLLAIFFLGACQEKTLLTPLPVETPVMLLHKLGFTDKPASILVNDQLLVLANEKRGLVFYEVGKETVLSEDRVGKQWLHHDGKVLYAFWWAVDETKGKRLKVRVSEDGGQTFSPEVVINNDTGVLPEISIAANGKGNIAVAYTDERKPGYGVYFNYSQDAGRTWLKEDVRVDIPVITEAMKQANNTNPATFAKTPKLVFLGERLVLVWQQADVAEQGGHVLRIISKSSTDYGKTWGAESEVFRAANMSPVEFVAFSRDTQMYIFAMLTSEDKGFTGFYNTDLSATQWATIANTALGDGFNKRLISIIKGTFSGENLVLAFTSEPNEGGVGKLTANIATLSTKTNEWLGVVRQLDVDKGHDLTKSTLPDLVNAGAAGVLVVWEDYRSLVPALYIDISKDNGRTWLPVPRPVTTPGLSVAKDPQWVLGKDKLFLMYFSVYLAGDPSGARMYQEFSRQPDGQFVFPDIQIKTPTAEVLKERLIERANKFWALREERKWEDTWDYMEPVYRMRFDKAQWLSQQGKLSFSKTVADESTIVITGNLALMDMNMEVGVSQHVSKEGVMESAPPKLQTVQTKWGWFYDDWYFIPNSAVFGNHLEY